MQLKYRIGNLNLNKPVIRRIPVNATGEDEPRERFQ